MKKLINLLVVEDEEFHRERIYKPNLDDSSYSVDYAASEDEAKEMIRCKYYDVAHVDIMLREDRSDRGGIEVIKFLHDMKESTSVIVVSGTDDIKVALNTYKAGVYDFLQKGSLHNPEQLLAPLERIIENMDHTVTNPYGRFSNVSAYLANPEMTPFWEDRWVRRLGTSYQMFTSALNNSLSSRIPILRQSGKGPSLFEGKDERSAYGYFWSKRIGKPIMMALSFVDNELPVPKDKEESDIIYERTFGNLKVAIHAITEIPRSEFCDSVWENQE